MSKYTKKDHQKFHEIAKSLLGKEYKEAKHELAELEIKHGEKFREEVEFELRLLRREQTYKQEAEMFYSRHVHIGKFPEGYDNFVPLKKEIFRIENRKRLVKIRKAQIALKRNKKIIEALLLYRIHQHNQHRQIMWNKQEKGRDKYFPHLIPKGMKGITAAISMEAERLFFVHQNMRRHYHDNPNSDRYGLTDEEKDMLKKIETNYFGKKLEKVVKREIKAKKKKQRIKERIKVLPAKTEKEIAKEYAKKVWYRKDSLKPEVANVLIKLGYQEADINHLVYDFDGNRVSCIGFKPEGFKNKSYPNDRRESFHHFSRPFLLKELSPSTEILVRVPDMKEEDRIVDAVIKVVEDSKEKRAAVEFQESHHYDAERTAKKVDPLLKAFDYVIIVCQDSYKSVYNQYKHERLFVLNNGEFKNQLKTWDLIGQNTAKNAKADEDEITVEKK